MSVKGFNVINEKGEVKVERYDYKYLDNLPTNNLISYILEVSKFVDGIYSLEETYPSSEYNITVSFDGDTGTVEQKVAYNGAQLVGMTSTNALKVFGEVPTIDIPVILQVVKEV